MKTRNKLSYAFILFTFFEWLLNSIVKSVVFNLVKNKRLISNTTLLLLFLNSINSFAQTPSWVWAKNNGGSSYDESKSVITDVSGNIYVVGEFYSSSITFGSTICTNAGGYDMFLVKYAPNGNILWAKSAGGSAFDGAVSVATDANSNVFVAGYYESPTITFGSITLTNTGNKDIFLVKYSSNGTVIWAKSAGGIYSDDVHSITTDAGGNIFLDGISYSPTMSYGSLNVTNTCGSDIFLVKYDNSGNALWAKTPGGSGEDIAFAIATDDIGNIYIAGGYISHEITFGPDTLTNNSNSYDIFLTKYNSNGNALWAKTARGTYDDFISSIAIDTIGNIYVTGSFSSYSLTFSSVILINSSSDKAEIFLVKYDASGNFLWAKSAGGYSYDSGSSVTDNNGNIFLSGRFQSPTINLGTYTLTNSSTLGSDMFIAKYSYSGNVLWVYNGEGNSTDEASSIASDASGNVFVTGSFYSDTLSFGSFNLLNNGYEDIFLSKLSSSTEIQSLEYQDDISVFPNPSTGKFTFQIEDSKVINAHFLIEIFNILGEKVYQQNNSNEVDISNYTKGLYLIKIEENNEKIHIGKILIF